MDIRDVAKDTNNNVQIVRRTVNEQAGGLCTPEQARVITLTLARNPTIQCLVEHVESKAATVAARGFTADDMRMIAAYALAAAAWLDMEAAEMGCGKDAQ